MQYNVFRFNDEREEIDMEDKQKIGVITEVGDLGLGFNELNEKDQKIVKEQQSSRNTK